MMMSEWPKRMRLYQCHDGEWQASERAPERMGVACLVYPAAAAPQPVAHVLIDADGSETHGPLLRSLPPGEYDLYTAPPDAEAIRHSAVVDSWQPACVNVPARIHTNPDAGAWADFFAAQFPGQAHMRDLMFTWFANAIQAGIDSRPDAEAIR